MVLWHMYQMLTGSTYRSMSFSVNRYMADRSGSGWMLMMSAGSVTDANFLSDDTATRNILCVHSMSYSTGWITKSYIRCTWASGGFAIDLQSTWSGMQDWRQSIAPSSPQWHPRVCWFSLSREQGWSKWLHLFSSTSCIVSLTVLLKSYCITLLH